MNFIYNTFKILKKENITSKIKDKKQIKYKMKLRDLHIVTYFTK